MDIIGNTPPTTTSVIHGGMNNHTSFRPDCDRVRPQTPARINEQFVGSKARTFDSPVARRRTLVSPEAAGYFPRRRSAARLARPRLSNAIVAGSGVTVIVPLVIASETSTPPGPTPAVV